MCAMMCAQAHHRFCCVDTIHLHMVASCYGGVLGPGPPTVLVVGLKFAATLDEEQPMLL